MKEICEHWTSLLSRLGKRDITPKDCFESMSSDLVAFAQSNDFEINSIGLAEAGQILRDTAFDPLLKDRIQAEKLPVNEDLQVSCARGIGFFLIGATFCRKSKASVSVKIGVDALDEYLEEIGMWPTEIFE